MPKYGLIKSGELLVSETMLQNYKPIEFAEVPEDFDQQTHYITQLDPINEDGYIYIGIQLNELVLDDEEIEDLPY